MVNYNKIGLALRTSLFTAAMFATASATASTVVVDGNLSDLQAAIAAESYNPQNTVTATDPNNDAGSNGFDITNGYAWYDTTTDTFYIGMTFAGQVGTSGGAEGSPNTKYCAPSPNFDGVAGVFDACETYGFHINVDANASVEYSLRMRGDGVANSLEGTEGTKTGTGTYFTTNGLAAGLALADWKISESGNAVEFSVTGLNAYLQPFGENSPRTVQIGFFAGSITATVAEDYLTANMQVVPVPAAAWLLGSGLAGLFGVAARKRSSHKL